MARYWVGGSGTWGTGGTTANWSDSSGGAGGFSLPNVNQDVIFDSASGSVTITLVGTGQCKSLIATTFGGTFGGSGNIQLLGSNTGLQGSGVSLELGTGMTYSYTGTWTIGPNNGSGSINYNGKTHTGGAINFNGAVINTTTAQWSLLNNITTTTNNVTFAGGTFNTNNYDITCNRFDILGAAATKVINFGTSVITLTNSSGTVWNNASTGGLTINGTYTIRTTGTPMGTGSITFIGGGATYYNVELLRGTGTGTFIIQGSNTFINFTDNTGTVAHDITWTLGTTQTFQNFDVRGASTSARVRFLSTGTGATPVLVKTGAGAVVCDYLNIGTNITIASPDNTWYAGYNSIGTGTGWVFRNPPGLLTFGVGG